MTPRLRTKLRRLQRLPHPWRAILGAALVVGGVLGFLPVLGFWMIPLGLLLLAVDFRWAKRAYLYFIVWWRRMRQRFRRWKAGTMPGPD